MIYQETLDFTIVFTWSCNLSCDYCKLKNIKKDISNCTLNNYIDLFYSNISFLKKNNIKKIEFLLFWWEPLLVFEKIQYFIENIKNIWLELKFKIYTNVLLLDEKKISYFTSSWENIELFFSIDWTKESMIEKRFRNNLLFDKFIFNIKNIKKSKLQFNISKVIYEKESEKLFNNLKYLHSLKPKNIYIYLVSYNYNWWFSKSSIIQVIKGLDTFINFLSTLWLSWTQIINYLGLDSYLEICNHDIWLMWDYDWKIYSCMEGLSIFDLDDKLSIEEKKIITLFNINKSNKLDFFAKDFGFIYSKTQNILNYVYNNELNSFNYIRKYIIKKFSLNL